MNTPALASHEPLGPPPVAYQRLQNQLARTSWICHGTLVCRPLVRRVAGRKILKGPYYLWTAKLKAKTVCLALSKAQYQVLSQAIANNRRLYKTLERMHALTLKTVLEKVPGVAKRK